MVDFIEIPPSRNGRKKKHPLDLNKTVQTSWVGFWFKQCGSWVDVEIYTLPKTNMDTQDDGVEFLVSMLNFWGVYIYINK